MQFKKENRILDLGCGYGPVGVLAGKKCPSCTIVLTEVNERALVCAKKNIKLNNIKNAKVKQSFYFSGLKGDMFDVILLNPPQSAGLDVCYTLIEGSIDHLNVGGSLQMVARRRKGGERLSEKMKEVFGNLEVLGKKSGYWVYKSVKEKS